MRVNVLILPEKKENKKDKGFIINEFIKVAKELTNLFNKYIDKELEVRVYHSLNNMKKDMFSEDIFENKFGNYNDEFDKAYIAHPILLEPIYQDNYIKKFREIIKYILLKYYLFNLFVFNSNFNLYKKNLINSISSFFSNNYIKDLIFKEIIEFDNNKKYSNKELIPLFIYSLILLNGKDYILKNLEIFFESNNLKHLSNSLFDKSPEEIITKAKIKLIKNKEASNSILKNSIR